MLAGQVKHFFADLAQLYWILINYLLGHWTRMVSTTITPIRMG